MWIQGNSSVALECKTQRQKENAKSVRTVKVLEVIIGQISTHPKRFSKFSLSFSPISHPNDRRGESQTVTTKYFHRYFLMMMMTRLKTV